ncbi:hypothetical protein TTRE_0000754001, partial [Trichuris trichiura]
MVPIAVNFSYVHKKATRRLGTVDGLRPGDLDRSSSRRPSVHVKSGVNMVTAKELTATRLGTVDGLRPGDLDRATSRRPSVRVKNGVNMVTAKELTATRSPGLKPSTVPSLRVAGLQASATTPGGDRCGQIAQMPSLTLSSIRWE